MVEPPRSLDNSNPPSRRAWTIPNILTVFRWVGSMGLIYFAWRQQAQAFVIWYLILALTDWIDGRIAVYFRQRSELGARLDSFADATLYVAVLIGALILWGDRLLAYGPWIAVACGSYALATVYGFIKFRRWPSYHTWTAKGSWLFVVIAIACLAWQLPLWPLAVAMACVTLANLESLAITYRLNRWQADVNSIFTIRSSPS